MESLGQDINLKNSSFQNNFFVAPYEYICHNCSNKIQIQQALICSNHDCSNKYCIFCLNSLYKSNIPFLNQTQNYLSFEKWKCPSCEGKCLCDKCKSKKINETQNQNNSFLGKKISSDAELIMWLSNGENENSSINMQSMKFPFVSLNPKIKGKVFEKLIKIAKQCELFYRHKCKNEYIKKNCVNCFETNFHQNDLLRFFNYETFLYYMKYLFILQNKIVDYSKENFTKNKNDYEELFKKFKEKKEVWVFKDTKIICKQCMFFLINKPNFFKNIKEIFLKQEKKIFLLNNNESKLFEKENFNNINLFQGSRKNIFKIIKTHKNQEIIEINNNMKNNKNIIINYNNHNNNIYNTLILNDKNYLNNNQIFGLNSLHSPYQFPFINNNFIINSNLNVNNYSNYFSSINSNYIKSLFIKLQKVLTDILGIVNILKNSNDKNNYFFIIDLLNVEIINYFSLIGKTIIYNINILNNILLKYDTNININNNIDYINLRKLIIEFIKENKNYLDLFNFLKFNYLNIENNLKSALFK